jgi:hypothetical protein
MSHPTGNGFVEIYGDWAEQRDIALCATVPQSFIDYLAGIGGSTLDLLIVLTALRALNMQTIILEDQAMEALRHYRQASFTVSERLNLKAFTLPDLDERSIAAFAVTVLTLSQTRHRPTRSRGDSAPLAPTANIGAKYGILSDMPLMDILCLAKLITACIARLEIAGEPVCRNLPLAHYDCRICAVRSATEDGFCKEDCKVWSGPRKAGEMRPGLYIRYIRDHGDLRCWPVTRIGPSYSELVLGSVGQDVYRFLTTAVRCPP